MPGLRTREPSDVPYHNRHAGDGRGESPSLHQLSKLDRRPRSSILAASHAPLAGLLEAYKKPESPGNKRKRSPASRGYSPQPRSMMDYNPAVRRNGKGKQRVRRETLEAYPPNTGDQMKWRAAALTQLVETTVSESKVTSSGLISGRNSALRNGAPVQTKSTMINAKEPPFFSKPS
jgi:hypothetical protein